VLLLEFVLKRGVVVVTCGGIGVGSFLATRSCCKAIGLCVTEILRRRLSTEEEEVIKDEGGSGAAKEKEREERVVG
jgi:hypothetical protein